MDDFEQIRSLKARYFRFVDTHDWIGLADVFAPDVEIDMTSEGGGLTHTSEAFLRILQRNLDGVTSVHHGHMPEIDIVTATHATGIWAMEDQLWWPDGSPIVHLHGYGHYHETYRKTSPQVAGKDRNAWVITSMKLTRLRRDIQFA